MPPKETATSKKKTANSKSFDVGDVVTYKMRGYPAWPGKIVTHEGLTADVIKEKPRQGTFYCVKFYPKGDYAWAPARDLTHLTKQQIDSYISDQGKKKGELLTGYQTAADPAQWDAEQDELMQAKLDAEEGVDELEDEDEGEDEKVATGSKRKAGGDKKAPAKKAKTEKAKPAPKKSSKVKSAATVESEDEEAQEKPKAKPKSAAATKADATKAAKKAAAAEKEAPAPAEEPAVEDADTQKVKDWRHKLQRAFLTPKTPASAEDMPTYDAYFTTIEEYSSMTIEQLQNSKIGKVMRKIAALAEIPRDDEFKFRERANTLMSKWQTQLSSAGQGEDGPTAAASTSKSSPKKNGTSPKEDVEMAHEEKKEDAPASADDEEKKEENGVENGVEDGAAAEGEAEVATPVVEDAPMEEKDAEGEKVEE